MIDLNKKKVHEILWGIQANDSNRFSVFLEHEAAFTDKEYWYALSIAYTDSDNLYKLRDVVKSCFNSQRPHKEYLMTPYERMKVASLPDKVTVYRGMSIEEMKSGKYGLSWTLSKKVAQFFAEIYRRNVDTRNHEKVVHTKLVDKKSIVCYFSDRKERELICCIP